MNGDEETGTIEGEVVQSTALAPLPAVLPPVVVDVDAAVKDWEAYQELVTRILTPDDYQKIGGKKMKKKSAWRKLGKAFNISCQVVKEEVERDNDYYPIYARVIVRATAPNGTYQEADQECHVTEKCCAAAWTTPDDCTNASSRHQHCVGGCNGRVHFSHPGDVIATATTRAKNRAISDIIGAGEVSAEELDGNSPYEGRSPRPAKQPNAKERIDTATLSAKRTKVRELLKALADGGATAAMMSERMRGLVPDAITDDGKVRYGDLDGDDCELLLKEMTLGSLQPPEQPELAPAEQATA